MTWVLITGVLLLTCTVLVVGLVKSRPAVVVDSLWLLVFGVGLVFAQWAWAHDRMGVALGGFGGMTAVAALIFLVRMVILKEYTRALRDGRSGVSQASRPEPRFAWFWKLFARRQRSPDLRQLDTRWLRMTFNRAEGTLSGTVRRGHWRGRPLKSLSFFQLMELREACLREDDRSVTVLDTWLDRHAENWRVRAGLDQPQADRAAAGSNGASGEMSRDEARLVLGVAPDAAPDVIKEAHRRLMQRLHPDLGGSTYLAAKVNEARDRLLQA